MALSNFTELKASIASWLHRSDLTGQIPDFIALAEESISRDLAACPVMWATSGLIALGQGANSVSLPADTLGLNWAKVVSPVEGVLDIAPPGATVRASDADTSQSGRPRVVAIAGSGGSDGAPTATIWPKADQAYTLQFGYRAALPALSDGAPVNFILKRAPSLYLYGSLLAASPYMAQDERIPVWESRYRIAVESITGMDWSGPALLRVEAPLVGGGAFDINEG